MFFAKYIYAAMIISSISGVAYFYYTDTQERISRLTSNLESYKLSLQVAQSSLDNVREEAARHQETSASLQTSLAEAESRVNELRSKFSNHDLTKLALRKPGLIETRINNGTKQVFDQLEDLTDPNRASADSVQQAPSSGSSD